MNLLPYLLLPLVVAANGGELTWSSGKNLVYGTSDLTSTHENGKIYLAGGCVAQTGHAFFAVMGVFMCDSIANIFYAYDIEKNEYDRSLPNLPRRRYRHAAAASNGHLFILGGRTVTDELIREIDVFNFQTGQWKTSSTQLTEEQAASDWGAFADGKNVYMVGGYDQNYNAKKNVWRIDTSNPDNISISASNSMYDARGDIRAHADGQGNAFVVGGYTHENQYCPALQSAEKFNIATGTWTKLNDLQQGRANMALTTLGKSNEYVVAVGGESPSASDCGVFFPEPGANTEVLDTVEVLDTTSGGWQSAPNALAKRYRFGDVVTVDNSKAYFFGGLNAYDATCKCYKTTNNVMILTATESATQPPAADPTQAPSPGPTQTPAADPTQAPSPGPTPEPTPEPTAQPTLHPTQATDLPPIQDDAPSPAFACFAGETTVEVMGKGSVSMQDLQLGDRVKVAGDKFSDVYSFGHYEQERKGNYLSITTDSNRKPLLITPDHMVLVNSAFVPASLVKVGDALTLASGNQVSVQSIQQVTRQGAFAPFTKDGSIVVNDVVASSFVALQPNSGSFTIGGVETWSLHGLAHLFEAPHRLVCALNFDYCAKETYNENGLSAWIATPLKLSQWLVQQAAWIQISVVLPALALFGSFAMVEMAVTNPLLLAVGFVTLLLLKRSSLASKNA